jgi:hypothetical protein
MASGQTQHQEMYSGQKDDGFEASGGASVALLCGCKRGETEGRRKPDESSQNQGSELAHLVHLVICLSCMLLWRRKCSRTTTQSLIILLPTATLFLILYAFLDGEMKSSKYLADCAMPNRNRVLSWVNGGLERPHYLNVWCEFR